MIIITTIIIIISIKACNVFIVETWFVPNQKYIPKLTGFYFYKLKWNGSVIQTNLFFLAGLPYLHQKS